MLPVQAKSLDYLPPSSSQMLTVAVLLSRFRVDRERYGKSTRYPVHSIGDIQLKSRVRIGIYGPCKRNTIRRTEKKVRNSSDVGMSLADDIPLQPSFFACLSI